MTRSCRVPMSSEKGLGWEKVPVDDGETCADHRRRADDRRKFHAAAFAARAGGALNVAETCTLFVEISATFANPRSRSRRRAADERGCHSLSPPLYRALACAAFRGRMGRGAGGDWMQPSPRGCRCAVIRENRWREKT